MSSGYSAGRTHAGRGMALAMCRLKISCGGRETAVVFEPAATWRTALETDWLASAGSSAHTSVSVTAVTTVIEVPDVETMMVHLTAALAAERYSQGWQRSVPPVLTALLAATLVFRDTCEMLAWTHQDPAWRAPYSYTLMAFQCPFSRAAQAPRHIRP
jgi:hypothetical protein